MNQLSYQITETIEQLYCNFLIIVSVEKNQTIICTNEPNIRLVYTLLIFGSFMNWLVFLHLRIRCF